MQPMQKDYLDIFLIFTLKLFRTHEKVFAVVGFLWRHVGLRAVL